MQVPDHTATTPAPGPEEAVIAALMSVGQLMKARLTDGIDPGTHHLLHQLSCGGALRITDLAGLSRLDTSTVSRHVATLERNGLVARTPHPDDGRAMAVDLTDQGRATLEQAIKARKQLLIGLLADWPRDEVETFARLLTVFAANADARRTELSGEPAPKPSTKTSEPSTEPSAARPDGSRATNPETHAELEHV